MDPFGFRFSPKSLSLLVILATLLSLSNFASPRSITLHQLNSETVYRIQDPSEQIQEQNQKRQDLEQSAGALKTDENSNTNTTTTPVRFIFAMEFNVTQKNGQFLPVPSYQMSLLHTDPFAKNGEGDEVWVPLQVQSLQSSAEEKNKTEQSNPASSSSVKTDFDRSSASYHPHIYPTTNLSIVGPHDFNLKPLFLDEEERVALAAKMKTEQKTETARSSNSEMDSLPIARVNLGPKLTAIPQSRKVLTESDLRWTLTPASPSPSVSASKPHSNSAPLSLSNDNNAREIQSQIQNQNQTESHSKIKQPSVRITVEATNIDNDVEQFKDEHIVKLPNEALHYYLTKHGHKNPHHIEPEPEPEQDSEPDSETDSDSDSEAMAKMAPIPAGRLLLPFSTAFTPDLIQEVPFHQVMIGNVTISDKVIAMLTPPIKEEPEEAGKLEPFRPRHSRINDEEESYDCMEEGESIEEEEMDDESKAKSKAKARARSNDDEDEDPDADYQEDDHQATSEIDLKNEKKGESSSSEEKQENEENEDIKATKLMHLNVHGKINATRDNITYSMYTFSQYKPVAGMTGHVIVNRD